MSRGKIDLEEREEHKEKYEVLNNKHRSVTINEVKHQNGKRMMDASNRIALESLSTKKKALFDRRDSSATKSTETSAFAPQPQLGEAS